jgi:hypothetical protein
VSLIIIDRPRIPEKLLLLVDIANIRPRGDGQIKRFLNSFKWRSQGSYESTTLEFIDRCIKDLENEAPGAVIVKFADRALFEALPMGDREEFFRRSELSFEEPEKIVLISTAQADKPLITAADALEATIISQDNFEQKELRAMMTSEFAIFKFRFDVEADRFIFLQKNGPRLSEWWATNVGELSDAWYKGDERLGVEYQLRSMVRELTYEFHSEPLTFRPIVPEDALEELERLAREREQQRGLIEKIRSKTVSFGESERTVFADEFTVLDEHIGRVILLIGRLEGNENGQWVEWFSGYRPIALVGPIIPDVYGKDRFVAVTGRLETDNSGLVLRLDPDRHFGYRMFNDVIGARPIFLGSEDPIEVQRQDPWRFPSFSHSFTLLRRIRNERATREKPLGLSPVSPSPESMDQGTKDVPITQRHEVEKIPDAKPPAREHHQGMRPVGDSQPPPQRVLEPKIVTPAKTNPVSVPNVKIARQVGSDTSGTQEQKSSERARGGEIKIRSSARAKLAAVLVGFILLSLAAVLLFQRPFSTGTPAPTWPVRYYELRSEVLYQNMSLGGD